MTHQAHTYSATILETYLDVFGHMNNAAYLRLFEEARWDLLAQHNYGISTIEQTGLGPTILEITIRFLRELVARDQVSIVTELLDYPKKIAKLEQRLYRNGELCCTALLTIALFDIKARKIVLPTPAWIKAIGGTP